MSTENLAFLPEANPDDSQSELNGGQRHFDILSLGSDGVSLDLGLTILSEPMDANGADDAREARGLLGTQNSCNPTPCPCIPPTPRSGCFNN